MVEIELSKEELIALTDAVFEFIGITTAQVCNCNDRVSRMRLDKKRYTLKDIYEKLIDVDY